LEPPTPHADFHREDRPGATLVRLTRRRVVSEEDVERIGEALLDLVTGDGRAHLVLDLAGVDFLSSAFLGKVLWLLIQVRGRGGRLGLCGLGESMVRLFQPSSGHPPEGLGFFDDPDAALAWVAADRAGDAPLSP
jgi:anti-anti-sigma factor